MGFGVGLELAVAASPLHSGADAEENVAMSTMLEALAYKLAGLEVVGSVAEVNATGAEGWERVGWREVEEVSVDN